MLNSSTGVLLASSSTTGSSEFSFLCSRQGIRDVISGIPFRDTIIMVASLDVDAMAAYHVLSSIYQSDRFFGNYAAGVGKTSITIKLTEGRFLAEYNPTIGMELHFEILEN